MYTTICLFFLTQIDIPEKFKVLVSSFYIMALYGSNVVISSQKELSLEELWSILVKIRNLLLLGAFIFLLILTMISVHKKMETRKFVTTSFERQRVLKETQLILDSVGEAVITYTEHGIKFFNR